MSTTSAVRTVRKMTARARRCGLAALGAAFWAMTLAGACDLGARIPVGGGDEPKAGRDGSAKTLGVVSASIGGDAQEQARGALARDAWRREWRFVDAVSPGFLFDATRVGQAEIDAGLWSAAELYELGGQLFQVTLTRDVGFGAKDLPAYGRFQKGARGGPDAHRCSTCHWRGGPAGAGDAADNAFYDGDGDRQSTAFVRNPIALAGAGVVEIVAREMTAELQRARDAALAEARARRADVRAPLVAKGVDFGALTARPDGTHDVGEIDGVGTDLVVRPFGWKGRHATIRDVVEESLLLHHGMQSDHLVATASVDALGPFGGNDPDGDGVEHEIEEGQVTALSMFIAMQEVPTVEPPTQGDDFLLAYAAGATRFEALGCARCHVPSLALGSTEYVLPSREGAAALRVDLAAEGAEPRVASPTSARREPVRVGLFSDLKRHDLGPALGDARASAGSARTVFLTRPLWGLARSRPYLHDGRAPTIEDAILAHGGEAQASRDAFAALADPERGTVRVFLTALTRGRRMISP